MVTALLSLMFTAIFACLGWIFMQQEGQDSRITVLESHRDTDRDNLMEYIKTRFDSVEGRLVRIEKKQDKEND